MHKKTRNPYVDHNTAPLDTKLHAAAQRAIDHYLFPTNKSDGAPAERPSNNLFLVSPNIDTETLLANASETLASAAEMATTLAFNLDESQRAIALGIQQLIELSALLVDRAQEQVAPATSTATA
jgi:hypothetical protein